MSTHAIRTLRERAGMSRVQLAEATGLDYGHLWRLEKGQKRALAVTMRLIANALAPALDQDVSEVLEQLTDPEEVEA